MRARETVVAAAVLLLVLAANAAEDEGKPERIQVSILTRTDWVLVAAPDDAEAPGRVSTASALGIRRALEPKTQSVYDATNEFLGCNPGHTRRAFFLEKAEFLLGEPILAELRVQLDGPGAWSEWYGGNYRARGRDDNFLFLMRHEDGTWVVDPYAPIQHYMGGLGSFNKIERGKPGSSWLAVQRWCAVERPGRYDLYCLRADRNLRTAGRAMAIFDALPERVRKGHYVRDDGALIDLVTGDLSKRYMIATRPTEQPGTRSPLLAKIPRALVARAKGNSWEIKHVTDYAHFRIVIGEGTDAERRRMVEQWTATASAPDDGRSMYYRTRAARQAIQYAQQDDFLPLIAKWIAADGDEDWDSLNGLAMRPSREATEMLLACEPRDILNAIYRLRRDKIADLIPHLIGWLTHDDVKVRYWAEWYLRTWTGQAFGHTWEGNDMARPTLDEGKAMQPAWREWWDKNKDGFTPV